MPPHPKRLSALRTGLMIGHVLERRVLTGGLHPAASRAIRIIVLALPGTIGACSAPPPRSSNSDQQAIAGCRAEADRVYNAQNRYQLSERDSRDTPNSGSGTTENPAAGLSDLYSHDQMVDDCLNHSAAVPVTGK